MSVDHAALLDLSVRLQRARTLDELVEVARLEVLRTTGVPHTWVCTFEGGDPPTHIDVSAGSDEVLGWVRAAPRIPFDGDRFLAEIYAARGPVIVRDAREDPRTNPAMVAHFKNRTIINVPLIVGAVTVGSLGIGSYGDEPVFELTSDQLDHLFVFGTQLAAALERIRLGAHLEEVRRERARVEQHLVSLQRLESLSVLSAGVAHDLNNQLAIVLGNLDLMAMDAEPADASSLGDATRATRAAQQVVRQLLAVGRSAPAARDRVAMGALARSAVSLVRSAVPRGIRLTGPEQEGPVVYGDATQIQQAVLNLVINARDALADRGAIEVVVDEADLGPAQIGACEWASPGRYVGLHVIDDGPGVPLELIERIWDPFFTTKAPGQGTGLGLAVVSRVARQHAGLVACASSAGSGCRFSLWLPAAA